MARIVLCCIAAIPDPLATKKLVDTKKPLTFQPLARRPLPDSHWAIWNCLSSLVTNRLHIGASDNKPDLMGIVWAIGSTLYRLVLTQWVYK